MTRSPAAVLVDASGSLHGVVGNPLYVTGTVGTGGPVPVVNGSSPFAVTSTGSLPVTVGNFPNTQQVAGSVAVYTQGAQLVSGTVTITATGSFPVTIQGQPVQVTGSVGVNGQISLDRGSSVNVPLYVSGAVGTYTQGTQGVSGSVSVTGAVSVYTQGPQNISGTVSVGNWPVAFGVSGSVSSYTQGPQAVTGSVNVYTQGAQLVSGTVNLGNWPPVIGISGSTTLKVWDPGTQSVSGSVSVYTQGAQLISGTITAQLSSQLTGSTFDGSPLVAGGVYLSTSGSIVKALQVDDTGQLRVVASTPTTAISITLSYDEALAVAGAQADYFYNGLNYTVPSNYKFNAAQFNSFSADNRVTARVSKFIVVGTFNVGTPLFTAGTAYIAPGFANYLEAEVTTVIGGTNDFTLTVTYTNQSGVASRTATALIKKNTPVGYKIPLVLQSGDYGVISVQNATRSAANTGVLSLKAGVEFFNQAMPTAALNYIEIPAASTHIVAAGEVVELAWASNAAATSRRVIKVVGTLQVA